MKKNGFTMIELLGVIAILGVTMIVAIPAVYKFVTKSRTDAYVIMQKAAYEAAQSKATNEMEDLEDDVTYTIEELAEEGYMDTPTDPGENDKRCSGTVTISKEGTKDMMDYYTYEVSLSCPSKTDIKTKVYKTDGDEEEK